MNTIVAIDVAKDASSFCVMGEKKSHVSGFSMTKRGFEQLLKVTGKIRNPAYFMESTGRYHLTLLNYLVSHRRDAFVVNPILVKNFSKANTLRKTKTDKIDARLIAEFAQQHAHSLKKAEYGLTEEIRSLARRREQIAEEIAKVKTQVKADLTVAFPEILSLNVFTAGMLRLLSEYASPRALLAAPGNVISGLLREQGKGRSCTVSVDQILALAKESIGIESYGTLARDSVKNLISVQNREKAVTEALLKYIREHQSKEQDILISVPGIGEITSAHFLAEVGDITKYPRYQNLIAYCGTDPSLYESGSIQKRGHITKRGNSSLRKYVYLMASGVRTYSPYFRAYYDKKREEGFPHRKAMVALMNKLLRTMFALLTKGEMYNIPE